MRRAATVVFFFALAATAAAQSERAPEYEVKAAFLYNFAKFVAWPSQAFPGPSAPLRICVFGEDPLDDALSRIVQGKTISGRAILNRSVESPAQAHTCHILFISRSERARVQQTLACVRDLPVLTVGDSADFLPRGGIINFVLEQDRVRFEINLAAAERQHLKISSKLLAVARIVNVDGGGP